MSHVIEIEIPRSDEDEALAIARDLAREYAVNANVYLVIPGRTFGDAETRELIATEEAAR